MSTYPRSDSPEEIERKIKEGRGQGEKESYLSWIYTHEIASSGVSSVAWSYKLNRAVHLLSQGELKLFHILEYSPYVIDFWENYPNLEVDKLMKLAAENNIRYPYVQDPKDRSRRYPYVLTIDMFVTFLKDGKLEFRPISFKYARTQHGSKHGAGSNTLENPRTLEKLELERLCAGYWGHKLQIMTNLEISDTLFLNLQQAHYHYDLKNHDNDAIREIATSLTRTAKSEKLPLRKIASSCDSKLGYEIGSGVSLSVAWHLIATHKWRVDLHKPISTDIPFELISSTI